MTSFYKAIEIAPLPENPRRLNFISEVGVSQVPGNILQLRKEYEKTGRIISILFDEHLPERKELFTLIYQSADRGFRGPNYNLADGETNLEEVKESIVDSAYKVRDTIFDKYLKLFIWFGVIPVVIGSIAFSTNLFGYMLPVNDLYTKLFSWIIAILWIPSGATICVFVEFALRMQNGLAYDQLLKMDPSRWKPWQRILITMIISYVFAFLLAYNVVQVGLGGLLLNDFMQKQPPISIAIGGITGLAFTGVQDIIYKLKPNAK